MLVWFDKEGYITWICTFKELNTVFFFLPVVGLYIPPTNQDGRSFVKADVTLL